MLFSLPVKWEANNVSTRIPPKQKVLIYCFASAIRIPYSEIIRIFRCLPFNLKFPFNLGCKQRFLLGTPYLKPRDNAGITQHLESNPTQPRVLTCFYWDGKSRLLRSVQGWTDREALPDHRQMHIKDDYFFLCCFNVNVRKGWRENSQRTGGADW